MSAFPDPFGSPAPTLGGADYDAAAQEFAAGAHPVSRELVLRTDAGTRMLVVAIDPHRQRRLGEIFAGPHPYPFAPPASTSRWHVLHGPGDLGPLAVRLDIRLRRPAPCRVHLLFSARDRLILDHAPDCSSICLVTERAFSEIEQRGRSRDRAIVLPAPSGDELRRALRSRAA